MFGKKLQDMNVLNDWQVDSAGTWAGDGLLPMASAIDAMSARGIDVSEHQSKPIDEVQLKDFQLILVMERGHQEAIRLEFPEVADRVYLLSEMTGSAYEVDDPVTGTLRDHSHAADVIEQLLAAGFDQIEKLSEKCAD